MAQVRILKIDTDGVPVEHDQYDEITMGSFSVSGGGPTMGVSGLDMNNTDIWDVQDLFFVDPSTSTINQTVGNLIIDDIMGKDRENIMTVSGAILFPTITDVVDEVDAFRLPTVSGVPSATPADGGSGYLVLNYLNGHIYLWNGSIWDDLSTVDIAENTDERYIAEVSITENDVVYISSADNVSPARADVDLTAQAIGFAMTTESATNQVYVRSKGIKTGLSGLTPTARYYLSAVTAGAVTSAVPTGQGHTIVQVGYAKSTTAMHVQIQSLGRRFKTV